MHGEAVSELVSRTEVNAQLERLFSVSAFASSARRVQLLRYLVDRAVAGDEAANEYAIGVDVFERPPTFDPRIESIVRTEVARLRQKLKEYYAGEGRGDRLIIEIPLRCYKPVFRRSEPEPAPAGPLPVESGAAAPRVQSRRFAFLAAVLGVALLGGTAILWISKLRQSLPIRSVAVLPFHNLSPRGGDDYLSDGLTDELTIELAKWKGLRVAARTSAYQFKAKGADVRQIGRLLDVDAVLEGSVARLGQHVRITAQLNRTADGLDLWSHSYDAQSLDMLNVQRDIAQAISAEVRKLGGRASGHIGRLPTSNPEALDLYLRASYQYALLTPESIRDSIGLFQAAIEKDSAYARAYVGLAQAELESTNFTYSPETRDKARAALEQALRLDPDSGEAHGLPAEIAVYENWDWPRSEREFQLAIEKGADASTRAAYGWSLAQYGRYADAQAQCSAAETAEPLGLAPRFCQAYVYYYQREFAKARRVLLETLDMKPGLIYAHTMLGRIALAEHDCVEAAQQFAQSARTLSPAVATIGQAYDCACRGERQRARVYLERAGEAAGPGHLLELAIGYELIGDDKAAIRSLQNLAAAREGLPPALREPAFDGLHADASFVALERSAGLGL